MVIIHVIALKPEDAQLLYMLVDESRAGLTNLAWTQTATLESTIKFLKDKAESQDQVFGIYRWEDGRTSLVGVIELRDKGETYELGYWLGTKFRGQGIMTDAATQVVNWAKAERPVTAHIRERNVASYKTLRHAGLEYHHTEMWEGEPWIHLRTPNGSERSVQEAGEGRATEV